MKFVPTVKGFILRYHIKNSRSHEELVSRPLRNFIRMEFIEWDGVNFPYNVLADSESQPVIFHQFPPPKDPQFHIRHRVIWIPMWDHIRQYPLSWWESLPKTIRVVSFSDPVSEICQKVGLHTLSLRFAMRPPLHQAGFRGDRVLFYWNRTGIFNEAFLIKLCQALRVKKLMFQSQTDPGIPKDKYYSLPSKIGTTKVEILDTYLSRQDYIKKTQEANIYLAPRSSEGAGLSFIEALARGCVVFAYDAPSMNEYIMHKHNGYLFKNNSLLHVLFHPFMYSKRDLYYYSNLSRDQDWEEIASLNLETLGMHAYRENAKKYTIWQHQIPAYADFILQK